MEINVTEKHPNNSFLLIICAILILMQILTMGLLVRLQVKDSVCKWDETFLKSLADLRCDLILPDRQLKIVSRDEWIAMPPRETLTDLNLPTNRTIIAQTSTESCSNQTECTSRVRFIQTFHMESRNFDDIAYNFLVGGDGAVYEGRGWNKQGAHTKGYNADSIGIAFIGTFTNKNPSIEQLYATKLLIEDGIKLGKLSAEYKLYGHKQLVETESPGELLYKIIKTWPHFSELI